MIWTHKPIKNTIINYTYGSKKVTGEKTRYWSREGIIFWILYSRRMLAIIQCRIFCLPVCYQKS